MERPMAEPCAQGSIGQRGAGIPMEHLDAGRWPGWATAAVPRWPRLMSHALPPPDSGIAGGGRSGGSASFRNFRYPGCLSRGADPAQPTCRRRPAWLAGAHLRSSRYPVCAAGPSAGDQLNGHGLDPRRRRVGFAGHSCGRPHPFPRPARSSQALAIIAEFGLRNSRYPEASRGRRRQRLCGPQPRPSWRGRRQGARAISAAVLSRPPQLRASRGAGPRTRRRPLGVGHIGVPGWENRRPGLDPMANNPHLYGHGHRGMMPPCP